MNSIAFKNLKEGDKLKNTLTQNIFTIRKRAEALGQVHYVANRRGEILDREVIVTASCSSNWELIGADKIFHLHSCHIPDCGICAMAFTERTKS